MKHTQGIGLELVGFMYRTSEQAVLPVGVARLKRIFLSD